MWGYEAEGDVNWKFENHRHEESREGDQGNQFRGACMGPTGIVLRDYVDEDEQSEKG